MQNFFIPQMGAWYLLTLFSYRIVLPETKRIKGVIVLGVLLTVFSCFLSIGSEFALKKSLGFFVYFMAGYKVAEFPNRKIKKNVARAGLAVVLLILIGISWKTDWYTIALSVLSRGADYTAFSNWYIVPIAYMGALVGTSIVSILVINAAPERCGWLEKQGADTMPMYLSHLIMFMAVGYLLNKGNWIITVTVSAAFAAISLILFSTEWYRKFFNSIVGEIRKLVMKEN